MAKWKITALNTGSLEMEKSIGTYLTDCGKIITIFCITFLLEELEGTQKIVVDTGFESVQRTLAIQKQKAWRNSDQELNTQLINMGVNPHEVETVILTHLHFDHAGNNNIFPNAKFFVQRKELQYAFAPLPGEERAYFSPLIGEKPSFWGTPFEIIQGDWEILDGIRIITSPGHTPGSQAVLVDTARGTYCIAGDNAFFYENIEKNIPVGHLSSRIDWFSSMEKMRRLSGHIIPCHDDRIFAKNPAVFP